MEIDEYRRLRELEASFWWFVGMRAIQEALLDQVLPRGWASDALDIGCGTGGNIAWLQRYVSPAGITTGLDIEPTALAYCRERGFLSLVQGSAAELPIATASQAVVTACDVVQQLPGDEPAAMFREIHRVLRPGGQAFVRSAAYQWMRSVHDTAVHSHSRFTVRGLADLAERSGLEVVRRTYANSALLPVAIVHRLVIRRLRPGDQRSDVKPLPQGLRWLDAVFASALRLEARLLGHPRLRLPFGLSAIVVVRRPVVAP
jgi:SAM-dependent methyltransferase